MDPLSNPSSSLGCFLVHSKERWSVPLLRVRICVINPDASRSHVTYPVEKLVINRRDESSTEGSRDKRWRSPSSVPVPRFIGFQASPVYALFEVCLCESRWSLFSFLKQEEKRNQLKLGFCHSQQQIYWKKTNNYWQRVFPVLLSALLQLVLEELIEIEIKTEIVR